MSLPIHLHHLENASRVNGPGMRYVIWTQGCHLNCPGCFNPQTHPFSGGFKKEPEELAKDILSVGDQIDGLTISGGEPLLQIKPLLQLLALLKAQSNLGVIVFTGFSWEESQKLPHMGPFLDQIDLLIAGRYQNDLRQAHHLIGSSNKTLHFLTDRYRPEDLDTPPAEVFISQDGSVVLSGINPLVW